MVTTFFSLKISVKSLIEYSLRSGSIDFRARAETGAGSLERAREGIALHKSLQKSRESDARAKGYTYDKEVKFAKTFEKNGVSITVTGRADGIINKKGEITIEEIKTTYAVPDSISERKLHSAQAMCYAYFYCLEKNEGQNDKTKIHIQITYFDVSSQETTEFVNTYDFLYLEDFFEDILDKYSRWAYFLYEKRTERDTSANMLEFPFSSYRKMQKRMCSLVYKTIDEKSRVFINAPTGTGKTISTVFPAIKALSHKKADKIFYLTAKTAARTAALDASRLLETKGLKLKTASITAKDKVCVLKSPLCEPSSCECARGHYDRLNEALFDIIKNENTYDSLTIFEYAERHRVCPYEYSLELASVSDIIICDYNYAFDPNVYLRRFFSESTENYVFLIDEAHNLVDRARDMYSAKLSSEALSSYSKRLSKGSRGIKSTARLKRLLRSLIKEIKTLAKEISPDAKGASFEFPPEKIEQFVYEFHQEAEKWLAVEKSEKSAPFRDIVLELYFAAAHFLYISEIFNEKYVCYCEKSARETALKLLCADPSENLSNMLDNAAASIFFSATLTPAHYFKNLLGGRDRDLAVSLPSPFPEKNLKVIVTADISARYDKRGLFYEDIADYIYIAVNVSKGSYFAFFPSYSYMQSVFDIFREKYAEIETIYQFPDMNEEQKLEFLSRFERNIDDVHENVDPSAFVAFAVLGGSFSEAIDLPGKKLIGAFIVSVGLPQISLERVLLSNFFDRRGYGKNDAAHGFSYSYIYPGMNKVLQAAGRVIRTSSDIGIIVLMDDRFSLKQYSSLFPESFKGFEVSRSKAAFERSLSGFWQME